MNSLVAFCILFLLTSSLNADELHQQVDDLSGLNDNFKDVEKTKLDYAFNLGFPAGFIASKIPLKGNSDSIDKPIIEDGKKGFSFAMAVDSEAKKHNLIENQVAPKANFGVEALADVLPLIIEAGNKLHKVQTTSKKITTIVAAGKKLAAILAGKFSAPQVIKYSKTAALASALPAILSTKGAVIGKLIAKPIVFTSTALAGLHAAKTGFLVAVPVALKTGLAVGTTWASAKLKDLKIGTSLKSGIANLRKYLSTSANPLANLINWPTNNLDNNQIYLVDVEEEVGPKSPIIATPAPIAQEKPLLEKPTPTNYFKYDTSIDLPAISIEKNVEVKHRSKRATEQPTLDLEVGMRLLKMAGIEDCIKRVICELGSKPNKYGQKGRVVINNLVQLQLSNKVRNKQFDDYRNALLYGRRSKFGSKMSCTEKYSNCKALTADLLAVASLVKLV